MNKNKTLFFCVGVIIVLLFFLLRENEGRIVAESQFKNIQFKAASVINEKGNAISELETTVGENQAKMQQMQEESEKTLAEKNEEMSKTAADFEQKAAQAEEEINQKIKSIADLETQMKENSDRFGKTIKKKNAELSEIGEELRKTTERLAQTLKKQETLESENFSRQTQLENLQRQVQSLKDAKAHADAEAKAAQEKPVPNL